MAKDTFNAAGATARSTLLQLVCDALSRSMDFVTAHGDDGDASSGPAGGMARLHLKGLFGLTSMAGSDAPV